MNSTTKFKASAISIATVLTFAMISMLRIAPSRLAASAALNLTATDTCAIPAGGNKSASKEFQDRITVDRPLTYDRPVIYSSPNVSLVPGAREFVPIPYPVPNGATVNDTVNLKNNGVSGTASTRKLATKVYRPDGSLAFDKGELVNPGQNRQVRYNGSFTGGSSCGNWKVEVINPDDNATKATATFTINFSAIPTPIIRTESGFGVERGQKVSRELTIPQSGDLTITAGWDPANIPLTFRLKKGNSAMIADSDTGVAIRNHPDKLALKYRVTQRDIQTYGAKWTLEVQGLPLVN